jgi:hypothetical protein
MSGKQITDNQNYFTGYPAKLSFKIDGKIKALQAKHKVKQFIPTKPA